MTRNEALERACDILGEHFDAVQVMATFSEEGVTRSLYRGSGNWYARQGMLHELLQTENADQIAQAMHREDGE